MELFKRFKIEVNSALVRDYYSSMEELGISEEELQQAYDLKLSSATFVGMLTKRHNIKKKTVTPPSRTSLLTFKIV